MSPEEYLLTLADPEYSLDIPEEDVAAIRAVTMPDLPEGTELDSIPSPADNEETFQPAAGEIIQELLTGTRSFDNLVSNDTLSKALSANHNPTRIVEADDANTRILREEEARMGWSPAQISTDEKGRKSIVIHGNGDGGFQSVGKYASPEEFMRINPEGFKQTNPVMWARMQAEKSAARQAPTLLTSKILSELDGQMETIQKEPDPLKRQLMLSQLEVDVAQAGANLSKEMRLQAEHSSGINQLREQLAQSEQVDRKNPDFFTKHGGRDSIETSGLRKKLQAAEKNIGNLTKQMIMENPTIAAMGVKVKNFLKIQGGDIAKDLARADKQADILDQAEQAILPEEVRRLEFITGKKMSDREAAGVLVGFTGKESKGKLQAWIEVSKAETDTDLIPLALKGNPFAKQIIYKGQMEKTGQSSEEVRKDLDQVFSIMTNKDSFIKAAKVLGGKTATEVVRQHEALSMMNNKEAAAEAAKIRAMVAANFAEKKRENSILGNVDSWDGDVSLRSNPEIAKTLDVLKTVNGSEAVSMEMLVDKYVMGAPKAERAARLEEIRASLKSTSKKYENAVFGSVNYMRLSNILDSHVAVSNQLGQFFDSSKERATSWMAGDMTADMFNPQAGLMGVR